MTTAKPEISAIASVKRVTESVLSSTEVASIGRAASAAASFLLSNATYASITGEEAAAPTTLSLPPNKTFSLTINATTLGSRSCLGTDNASSDDEHLYVRLSTFWYCFLAFITTIGLVVSLVSNMIIIYLFTGTPSLRKNPSNIIAVNLSLSDLLLGIQWPSVIYCCLTQSTWLLEIDYVCQTFGFITVITASASVLTVLAMSLERAIVIRCSIHPAYKGRGAFSLRHAYLVVLLIWLLSLAFAIVPLFKTYNRYTLDPSKTSCTLDYLSGNANYKLYTLIMSISHWLVPALIISLCYALIIRTFDGSSRSLKQLDANSSTRTNTTASTPSSCGSTVPSAAAAAAAVVANDTDKWWTCAQKRLHLFLCARAEVEAAHKEQLDQVMPPPPPPSSRLTRLARSFSGCDAFQARAAKRRLRGGGSNNNNNNNNNSARTREQAFSFSFSSSSCSSCCCCHSCTDNATRLSKATKVCSQQRANGPRTQKRVAAPLLAHSRLRSTRWRADSMRLHTNHFRANLPEEHPQEGRPGEGGLEGHVNVSPLLLVAASLRAPEQSEPVHGEKFSAPATALSTRRRQLWLSALTAAAAATATDDDTQDYGEPSPLRAAAPSTGDLSAQRERLIETQLSVRSSASPLDYVDSVRPEANFVTRTRGDTARATRSGDRRSNSIVEMSPLRHQRPTIRFLSFDAGRFSPQLEPEESLRDELLSSGPLVRGGSATKTATAMAPSLCQAVEEDRFVSAVGRANFNCWQQRGRWRRRRTIGQIYARQANASARIRLQLRSNLTTDSDIGTQTEARQQQQQQQQMMMMSCTADDDGRRPSRRRHRLARLGSIGSFKFGRSNGGGGDGDGSGAASRRDSARARIQIRLAKMSFYLILLWLVSWTPIASLAMINSIVKCHHRASALAVFLANTMTKLGPAFDVLIYGISHPSIKRKFKLIIWKLLTLGRVTSVAANAGTSNATSGSTRAPAAASPPLDRRTNHISSLRSLRDHAPSFDYHKISMVSQTQK